MPYTIFDGHCDTIQKLCDTNQSLKSNNLHVSIDNMKNNYHIQVFAAFIDKKEDKLPPLKRCNQLIDKYYTEINKNRDSICHCNDIADINHTINQNKVAALLSIEGGDAVEGSLDNLLSFYDKGVRLMTLTWNYDNEISGSIGETDTKGLTCFGKTVVEEMNSLDMVIDVSHISNQGFWDVIEHTKKPIAATHSNVYSLKKHKRNLSDEQIRAVINNNGFIGINLYSEFLADTDCSILDVMRHIEYILALGGENNIGFGTDFDGMDSMPREIHGICDICKIPDELIKIGYSDELIEKITYKNFLRLFNNL